MVREVLAHDVVKSLQTYTTQRMIEFAKIMAVFCGWFGVNVPYGYIIIYNNKTEIAGLSFILIYDHEMN